MYSLDIFSISFCCSGKAPKTLPPCSALVLGLRAEAKVETNLSGQAEYSPSLMSFLATYFLKGMPRNWPFPH